MSVSVRLGWVSALSEQGVACMRRHGWGSVPIDALIELFQGARTRMEQGRLFVAPMGQIVRYVLVQRSVQVQGAVLPTSGTKGQLRLAVHSSAGTEAPCEDTKLSLAVPCSVAPATLPWLCQPNESLQVTEFEGYSLLTRAADHPPSARVATIHDSQHFVLDVSLPAHAVCGQRTYTVVVSRATAGALRAAATP